MNLVILRGRLGKDPETSYTTAGTQITRFSLATSKRYTDKATGQKTEKTEWHRIVFWDRLAGIAAQYLSKGKECLVTGELQTRQFQDRDGQTRSITEINGRELELIGGRGEGGAGGQGQGQGGAAGGAAAGAGPFGPNPGYRPAPPVAGTGYPPATPPGGVPDFDDDIPF
jgi:single-strand DNA-binding protein